MAVYKSKGIVLRSIRYGEADRILDLYTRDAGLISGIAKGIRRTKSRFGARLEPLSCVDFMAYQGRSLDTITQVETLRSFHEIREDLSRYETAGRIVQAVRALSGGDEADRRIFNLLYHALESLANMPSGHGSIEAAFSLKLAILAGYAPQLDACLNCEVELQSAGNPYFSPPLGGVLCSDCKTLSSESFPIAPRTLERLKYLVERPLRELAGRGVHDEGLTRVARAHVFAHAPGSVSVPAPKTQRPA